MQLTRQHEKPPLDLWLCGQLHAQHDSALEEAIPDEMLRLVDSLADHR